MGLVDVVLILPPGSTLAITDNIKLRLPNATAGRLLRCQFGGVSGPAPLGIATRSFRRPVDLIVGSVRGVGRFDDFAVSHHRIYEASVPLACGRDSVSRLTGS